MRFEDKLRSSISQHVSLLETLLYVVVGILLIAAAIMGVVQAALSLSHRVGGGAGYFGLAALDQLLLVLMLVEILHTVSISIRTHKLTMVPFLVVGLIASIRRVLVITMQAARLAEQNPLAQGERALSFNNSMIELGVLAVLILVFVMSIARLHVLSPSEDGPSA
jgi:uncharacterized membrane protein (DUF373 family)